MKKIISYFLFVLMIAVLIFELYFSIAGAIDIKRQWVELAAREASGHEYLGVPVDFLVFGVVLISVVGFAIYLASWKIAQGRVVRVVSAATCPLFLLPFFVCTVILTS